jgi:hypothetical protein
MSAKLDSRVTYATAMATLAVFVAIGGGAYAVAGSSGSDGVIHGCARKKSGTLRVVNSGVPCKKSERAVTWNDQGPPGAAGQEGAAGAAGSALAFAHVFGATAAVDAANSKNVTDAMVSHGIGVGDFCFDLPFTPKSVVVTVDLGSQDTGFATAQLGASAGNCPASAEASVHVSVATNPPHGENDDFFVVFN